MSKPTPPVEFDREKRRAERLHEARRVLRRLPPAGKLEAIAKLMSTFELRDCPTCMGTGKAEWPKEPLISKEDALLLLEEINAPRRR